MIVDLEFDMTINLPDEVVLTSNQFYESHHYWNGPVREELWLGAVRQRVSRAVSITRASIVDQWTAAGWGQDSKCSSKSLNHYQRSAVFALSTRES